MKSTNEYLIPFIGLKLGKHQFEFKIERTFFDAFSFDEYESCDIAVEVVLDKKTTLLEINFKHKGTVNVKNRVNGGAEFTLKIPTENPDINNFQLETE